MARDELRQMYQWVRPRIAIPTHGEPDHMRAHAELAREDGVPRQLAGRNGDLFMIAPLPGMRRGAVPAGRVGVGENGLQPCDPPPGTIARPGGSSASEPLEGRL